MAYPHILIAPDKMRGALSAAEIAGIVAEEIRQALPSAIIEQRPMADGGESTAEALGKAWGWQREGIWAKTAAGLLQPVEYWQKDKSIIVDSASLIGLQNFAGKELTPWLTSSYALGQFLRERLEDGIDKIYLGIGGTATIDAGIGMLQAFGARFFDVMGHELPSPLPPRLMSLIYAVDLDEVPHGLLRRAITVLADVELPLLDSLDFALQKGVKDGEMPLLRNALENLQSTFDELLFPPSCEPRFAGAGGGIAYTLERVLRCEAFPGAEFVAEQLGIFNVRPSLLITGEGRLDAQSLQGKVVGTFYHHCAANGIPLLCICGQNALMDVPPSLNLIEAPADLSGTTEENRGSAEDSLRTALRASMPKILALASH